MLPDDFDSTVVHKRVNGDGCWKAPTSNAKGIQRAGALAQDRIPTRSSTRDNLDAQTGGYYWVDARTGEKELIYRDPKVDVDEIVFNDDDEAIAAKSQYDYPTYVPLKPGDPLVTRRQRLVAAFPDHQITIESSTADGIEHVLQVHSDRDQGKFYLWNEYDGKIRFLSIPGPR